MPGDTQKVYARLGSTRPHMPRKILYMIVKKQKTMSGVLYHELLYFRLCQAHANVFDLT